MLRVPARGLLVAMVLASGVARADGFQDSAYRRSALLSATWELGVPTASLADFVEANGYGGGQLEVRLGVVRRLSVGLATSWSWFAENAASRTVEYANATVSGPLYQRVRFASARATAHWYLGPGPLQPYLGVGCGPLSWETYRVVSGSVEKHAGWALAADPQLGVLWTIGKGLALHVQAHAMFTRARFSGVEEARWLGFQAGLALY